MGLTLREALKYFFENIQGYAVLTSPEKFLGKMSGKKFLTMKNLVSYKSIERQYRVQRHAGALRVGEVVIKKNSTSCKEGLDPYIYSDRILQP